MTKPQRQALEKFLEDHCLPTAWGVLKDFIVLVMKLNLSLNDVKEFLEEKK